MHPVLYDFELFGLLSDPWSLHTYGVLIATGFLLAMTLVKEQAAREGEDPESTLDLCFKVLLAGLIGSRIVFIMTRWDYYSAKPIELLYFWKGGLVFYGGFILAAFYVAYYARQHRLNYFKFADIIIPYLALAHAFGRLGCVAAGCCFGKPTDLAWGVVFPEGSMAHSSHLSQGLISGGEALAVHPTQLYESGFEMVMFWLLVFIRPHKRFHGQLFLIWLAIYPIFRSTVELYRGDKLRGVWLYGVSTSQYISIGVAAFAIWLFFHLRKKRAVLDDKLSTA
jgi:phosphatidylglycerol---prolipoprotein diacylglyceryl transferase